MIRCGMRSVIDGLAVVTLLRRFLPKLGPRTDVALFFAGHFRRPVPAAWSAGPRNRCISTVSTQRLCLNPILGHPAPT